jgi:hypothetical protein
MGRRTVRSGQPEDTTTPNRRPSAYSSGPWPPSGLMMAPGREEPIPFSPQPPGQAPTAFDHGNP